MTEFVNNSGQGPQSAAPAEVLIGFNWGACFLNWIWGLGNKSYITLLIFVSGFAGIIPFVGMLVPFAMMIWFGIKGNEWAWQNKQWDSLEHFHSVQKTWAIWGIVLFILGIILSVTLFAIIGAVALSSGALNK